MQDFRKLRVWVKAHLLTLAIYRISGRFPKSELFGITKQIRRSAFSISSNIVEGCGKYTNNDFASYLNILLGSTNETEYFLILARDLSFIQPGEFSELEEDINEVRRMLINLIRSVRSKARTTASSSNNSFYSPKNEGESDPEEMKEFKS